MNDTVLLVLAALAFILKVGHVVVREEPILKREIILIGVLLLCVLGVGAHVIFHVPVDNPAEIIIDDIVESETGINLKYLESKE